MKLEHKRSIDGLIVFNVKVLNCGQIKFYGMVLYLALKRRDEVDQGFFSCKGQEIFDSYQTMIETKFEIFLNTGRVGSSC